MSQANKKFDAKCQKWLSHVTDDKIELILDDVVDYLSKSKNEAFAFKCILILSKLAFDDKCSSPKALLQLVKACCETVAPNYAVDQRKLLNALYHTTRYFLKKNCMEEAKLISQNVIKMKEIKKIDWSKEEENTMIAFIHLYSNTAASLNFAQSVKVLVPSSNKISSPCLWNHLLALTSCSNKKPFGDLFFLLVNVSLKSSRDNKDNCAVFLLDCLNSFLNFYEKNSISKEIKLDENTLICFLKVYRQIVLNYVSLESFSTIQNSVISILKKVRSVFCHTSKQVVSIQFCEKILQLLCKSVLSVNLDQALILDCLGIISKWDSKSELFYNVSFLMCNVLLKLKPLWMKIQLELPDDILVNFIKIISKGSQFLDGYRTEVCTECKLKCDETVIIQTNCFIFSLLIFSRQNSDENKNKMEGFKLIYQDVSMLLADSADFIIKMCQADCPKFTNFFPYVLPYFSNLVHLYLESGMFQNVLTLAFLVLRKFATLPQSSLEQYFNEKYLIKFLRFICHCSLKLESYDLPLPAIAAWIIISPSKKSSLFELWTVFKMDVFSRKNVVLKETIITVLELNFEKMKDEWNLPLVKKEDYGSLLFEEIKSYSEHYLPIEDCFYSIFEESRRIKIDIFLEAMLICCVLRFLVNDRVKLKQMVDILDRLKEVEVELCIMKKTSGPKEKIQINILLGCSIIARARCLIIKARDEIESQSSVQLIIADQPKNQELGIEVNCNDVCNVTPVFSNLKLEKQEQLFLLLSDGIKYLSVCCNAKLLPAVESDLFVLSKSIVDAAFIYKLYGYEKLEYSTWELCFKFSSILKNDEECIVAVSHLLCFKGAINTKWLAHTEKLVSSLDPSKSHLKYAYDFARIRNSFLKGDSGSVSALFSELKGADFGKSTLISAEYHLLLSKCFFNPDISPKNSALEAYVFVASAVKEKKWKTFAENCQVNCLLFEVSLNLSQNFLELMLPREARCYLKSQLKLAYKLALPLRLAQIVVHLAWADITCCNEVDSRNKIGMLEEIFQFQTRISDLVPSKPGKKQVKAIKVDPPDFITHVNCACFACSSPMLQATVVETIRLQAAFANLQPETRNYCLSFFKCGLNTLEKIYRNKKEEWTQLSEMMFFAQFIDHLTLNGDLKEAMKLNKKLSKCVSSFSEHHPCQKILSHEVFELALSLEYAIKTAV